MEPEIALEVPIQENLPMKKKGWRRFLSFFTSGKSKSKEVVEKNHKDVKTPEPGMSEAQIYQVKSEAAVLLNSEEVRLAETLPMVSKKRKFLSLQRMFGKANPSKNCEKSSNKIFSSNTCVEVYDFSDKLTENDKAAVEYIIQVSEVKTECIESNFDSEIAKVTSASNNNDNSEVSNNLIESLSESLSMSDVNTIDRSLLGLGSSYVEEKTKKGNFSRFFKNRFGRRSPSKMNLSSKTIVEFVDEDGGILEEININDISDEVQGIENEDKPLENESHIDQVERQMEHDISHVECKINQEQQLRLESVEPTADDPQEVESNDLEMPKKTKDENEAQLTCSVHKNGILEADNMPVESKNKVVPDQTSDNAPSRPESPKKDADSKDYQIFINHRPSKNHRIKKLRFNLPTIDELPENEEISSDPLKAVESTKTDRELTKKESKLEAVIDDILLNEEIKSELIPEDDMTKSDCNAVTNENKSAELCKLSMIGDNPNVGQDNCENALLSNNEGDVPKNNNNKKFVEVTEILTEQI